VKPPQVCHLANHSPYSIADVDCTTKLVAFATLYDVVTAGVIEDERELTYNIVFGNTFLNAAPVADLL